jgi:hypothetical protein
VLAQGGPAKAWQAQYVVTPVVHVALDGPASVVAAVQTKPVLSFPVHT